MTSDTPRFAGYLLGGWMLLVPALALAQQETPAEAPAEQFAGVAVLELFTSENCQACPPAEAMLGQIADIADERSLPIFCLAMHVDYFDRPGRRDPFSSAVFTRRQRAYATRDGQRGMFTPQMVVNGTIKFSGTDAASAENAIAQALATPARVEIELDVDVDVNSDDDQPTWEVRFEVKHASAGDLINVALVENQTTRDASRGARRRHAAVVREFASLELGEDGQGHVALSLPGDVAKPLSKFRVIAFVQTQQTLATTGATQWQAASDD